MAVPVRKFNTSDVNMLTAGKVVDSNAIRHLVIISDNRPDFDLAFFTAQETRIDDAIRDVLGLDPYEFLRPKTHTENVLFDELLDLLVTFHKQMERGYRDQKGVLKTNFTKLGFTAYWTDVSINKNQNRMIDLLSKFDSNMTVALETQIYTHKIQPGIIALIRSKILPYNTANAAQEAQKPVVHELTAAEVNELNEIFDTIMDICIICWDIFKKDHVVRDEFSFNKIVKNMGNHKYHDDEPIAPEET